MVHFCTNLSSLWSISFVRPFPLYTTFDYFAYHHVVMKEWTCLVFFSMVNVAYIYVGACAHIRGRCVNIWFSTFFWHRFFLSSSLSLSSFLMSHKFSFYRDVVGVYRCVFFVVVSFFVSAFRVAFVREKLVLFARWFF